MALTAYQGQFKRRMKKALRLRERTDKQARALATRLADALTRGESVTYRLAVLNALYGTSVSDRTDLQEAYRVAGTAAGLLAATAASGAGVPLVVFADVADANGGAKLPDDEDLD